MGNVTRDSRPHGVDTVSLAGAIVVGDVSLAYRLPRRPASPRLLDRVRRAIRVRHYSPRTEKSYVGWVKRFVLYHGKRHPSEMGAGEVRAFLSYLATDCRASASTQNQALSALLFL